MKANTNKSLFCEYHNGFGHKTEDCYDLRDAVEQLIKEGRLGKHVASQRSPQRRKASDQVDKERWNPISQRASEIEGNQGNDEEQITRTINVITGGFARGGTTKSSQKKHLQEILNVSSGKIKKASTDVTASTENSILMLRPRRSYSRT